jgi:hypothetical protein
LFPFWILHPNMSSFLALGIIDSPGSLVKTQNSSPGFQRFRRREGFAKRRINPQKPACNSGGDAPRRTGGWTMSMVKP